jgi:hypothetical protein
LKNLIHNHVANLSANLAGDLQYSYGKEIDSHNTNMAPILKVGFGLGPSDAYEFLQKSEISIYASCVAELK